MKNDRKKRAGQPKKFSPEQVKRLKEKFELYIEENSIPIIMEFTYKNNITKDILYDYAEFSDLLKKCVEKKQANLEKATLANKVNTAMAIFSLKQMGWRDRSETEHTLNEDTKSAIKEMEKIFGKIK